MNLIIDTSAYSGLARGNVKIAKILSDAQQVYVPSVVIGELRAGFAFGAKRQANEKLLDRFMAEAGVSVLHIGDDTPDIFAEIYVELRKAGRPIGQNDLWIAALAREHRLALLTLDNDFSYVKDLELVSL